jgi:Zn ribbon nucleic-acid-binding protein
MREVCPRCSLQVAGWVFYEDNLVECLSCGYILKDMTPLDYDRNWKYRIRKLSRKKYHRQR